MLPFNVPPVVGNEIQYINQALNENKKISGDGPFTKKCSAWIREKFSVRNAYLTTSGTSALEMAALLLDIQPGDEVIMPSYTFVSTANAFLLRGAVPVFVDVRPDTMNIDENKIEAAITKKTKAIVPVHYAGVSCEMDTINDIARRYHLAVVEDAAQGFMSTYKGRYLGTVSDYGCFSFHETKNISMGEGGAIIFNSDENKLRAEIFREKGTNRSRFFRGEIDKYTWMDKGSSYLPSDINAAFLYGQLNAADKIYQKRMHIWNIYYDALQGLQNEERIRLPFIPDECVHNAHMFYIKCKDLDERTKLIAYLKEREIETVFHYIPLHTAPAGKKYARFNGRDEYTTVESERLLRLPLFYSIREEDALTVAQAIEDFYHKQGKAAYTVSLGQREGKD